MGKITRKMGLTTAFASVAFLPIVGANSCDNGLAVETQTFELQYMNPGEAMEMVRPYVYGDRESSPGVVSAFREGLTVRETRENLRRIEQVLSRYDVPTPAVRLHFQLIEADGFSDVDPRIADVQGALEELFRFEGYRLTAEPQMAAMQGTSTNQVVYGGESEFFLEARIDEVRGSGSVVVNVHLFGTNNQMSIQTAMSVPVGQTIVLGSSNFGRDQPTLILTVRPELVTLPH